MNNPINTTDDDGELPVIVGQFLVGGVIGAFFETVAQLNENGGDFRALNGWQIGAAFLAGGASAIAPTPFLGVLFSGLGSAMIESFNPDRTGKSIAEAFGIGVASSLAGNPIESAWNSYSEQVLITGIKSEEKQIYKSLTDSGYKTLNGQLASKFSGKAANTVASCVYGSIVVRAMNYAS